jgi:hypothetical protein
MSDKTYHLASPEILKLLNIREEDVDPARRQSFVRNLVDRLGVADVPGNYENAFVQQGALPSDINALDKYLEFDPDWKTPSNVQSINKLAEIAHTKPNSIYSYNLSESPLYRGAKVDPSSIPAPGQEFSFDRFRSFTPDILTATSFVKGDKPFDFANIQSAEDRDPNKIKTIFQIQQDLSGKYSHLITPGAAEPEVIVRPDAKYVIESKTVFPFNQRGLYGDTNIINLRQVYNVDPIGAAVQGGKNLIKENVPGAAFGAALSMLNPEITKTVKNNNYKEAASSIAKDLVLGSAVEQGLKTAGKYVPVLNKVFSPAAQIAAPIAVGSALFTQGNSRSLTDVLTKKAAKNPVSWLPSVKANPKTDLGARASRAIGNEMRYTWQKLLEGKIPYTK